MKILVLGAGEVGSTVARNLVGNRNNDVTVIDKDERTIQKLGDAIDIQTILGNAASPVTLAAAKADDADLLLALTRSDECNLVACLLCKKIFHVPSAIARVSHSEFIDYGLSDEGGESRESGAARPKTALDYFCVDESICPEQLVQEQVMHLFAYPNALQVLEFADGKAQMIVARSGEGGWCVGLAVDEIYERLGAAGAQLDIVSIYRNASPLQVTGKTRIILGDEVAFVAPKQYVPAVMDALRGDNRPAKKIMIAGGGNIGFRIAKACEERYNAKLIESSPTRAAWLADRLDYTLVLLGSATSEEMLERERVEDVDVFCAVTDLDEDNIMSSLLAKNYGAKRVISIVNRPSYVDLIQGNKIDIVLSPHTSTIGSILAHIRRSDVVASHPMRRGHSEALEAVVHGTRKTSKIVGRPKSQLRWPHGCSVAAIYRGDLFIPGHASDYILEDNDHVIFYAENKDAVSELEKMIQVKLTFF